MLIQHPESHPLGIGHVLHSLEIVPSLSITGNNTLDPGGAIPTVPIHTSRAQQ